MDCKSSQNAGSRGRAGFGRSGQMEGDDEPNRRETDHCDCESKVPVPIGPTDPVVHGSIPRLVQNAAGTFRLLATEKISVARTVAAHESNPLGYPAAENSRMI